MVHNLTECMVQRWLTFRYGLIHLILFVSAAEVSPVDSTDMDALALFLQNTEIRSVEKHVISVPLA